MEEDLASQGTCEAKSSKVLLCFLRYMHIQKKNEVLFSWTFEFSPPAQNNVQYILHELQQLNWLRQTQFASRTMPRM
jgi:hypothetical protein